ARPSSAAARVATTSEADFPARNSLRPSVPKKGLTSACVATAPSPDCTCGTSAPTAKNLLATAMPNFPLSRSRAMIDQVTEAHSVDSRPAFAFGTGNPAAPPSPAVEIGRQPERHPRPQIHDHHAHDDDQHVRHHARENL